MLFAHLAEPPSIARPRRVRAIHARAEAELARLHAERLAILERFRASAGAGSVRSAIGAARARLAELIRGQRLAVERFFKGAEAAEMEKARERLDDV